MEWIKDKDYTNTYYTTKKFNGYQYNVFIVVEDNTKSVKYWVSVSSGKKRAEFEIFEDKENKSLGGIRALFWIKEAMYNFPEFYSKRVDGRNQYICIGWADSRRRDIYARLQKEGFTFTMEWGKKVLMKKL